jgi:hypothetical protein
MEGRALEDDPMTPPRRRLLTLLASGALALVMALGVGAQRPRTADAQVSSLIADLNYVVNTKGYDPFGLVLTYGPDGSTPLIAIAGTKIGSADGYNQWVFFFTGTTFIGTDTFDPSPGLQLVGSPGSGQVNVQYVAYAPSDPLCCPTLPPVTITYTWNGSKLTPNATPPGH